MCSSIFPFEICESQKNITDTDPEKSNLFYYLKVSRGALELGSLESWNCAAVTQLANECDSIDRNFPSKPLSKISNFIIC